MENYLKTITNQFEIIQYCIKKGNSVAASILLFSMIDSFSWLCNTKEKGKVGDRFITWTEDWLLPTGYPQCTSRDLYGARCGLIHRLTGESDLFDAGKARRIIYTYGTEDEDYINSLRISFPEHSNFYALNLDKFLVALNRAMTNCFEYCMKDEGLKKNFMDKVDSIQVDVNYGEMEK